MTTDSAIAFARSHQQAHLEALKEILRIPSISTLPENREDVAQTAAWLADRLRQLNMEKVTVFPTPGHPVVFAQSPPISGRPTVLVYGHYDVQPADPLAEWHSDPFEPTAEGDWLIARGASDMKGQLLAHLCAVEAMVAQGPLPVNLKYMLEGEEEIGSPNLPGFIEQHQELLACDVVLNCDSTIHAKDIPAITYSLRGLAYFELMIQTAQKDMHSGRFGGTVLNPIHVLSELIAGLHDEHGRVTLPGFYDSVRTLSDEERRLLGEAPHRDEAWLEMAGAKALCGEEGYSTVERVGARPALDVNGIWGGFTGEGAKTVLPARAFAKLSMRLVADQTPAEAARQLEAYLAAQMPKGVNWECHYHSGGAGATMDIHSPYMAAASRALEQVFEEKVLFKREGGSIPVVGAMQELLGVDSIMLGFGLPDDGIHGPNERQYIPNYYRGIETHIHFLENL